jgi:hypothetical protein
VYDQQPSDTEISPCSIFQDVICCFESFMSQDLWRDRRLKVEAQETSAICEDGGTPQNSISQEELVSRRNIAKIIVQKQNFTRFVI